MSTVINTNLASLFAQNSLTNAQNNLATSVQRLSSGLRINSAKDDAAGLAIAQNMQSQILGTNQSINNLSDATNLLQTADSSLSTIQDMLLKMKQLAVQGYDGSLNATQKADIVTQMQDLNNEINATAQRTQFNGINLLTSGSSIDAVNSDLKTGATLVNTQVAVLGATQSQGLGYYSTNGSAGAAANLGDSAYTGSGAVNSTFKINIDPALQNQTPGTYTLTSNGANLTLTGTINGLATSQTVVVGDVSGGNQGGPGVTNFHQNLNFSNFGINIDTYSTVSAGTVEQGQNIASALVAKGTNNGVSTIQVGGTTASISDVRLSGVAPGTYTMTFDNLGPVNSLSLPANQTGFDSSGVAGTRVVSLSGGTGTGASAAVSYDATGKITGVVMQNQGTGYKAGDVLSMSAAANPTDEISKVQFGALAANASFTLAGLTFTAGSSGATAAQVASAFANIPSTATAAATITTQNGLTAAVGSLSGTSTAGISTGAVSGINSDTLVFDNSTSTALGAAAAVTTATVTKTNGSYNSVSLTAGTAGTKETDVVTLSSTEGYAKGTQITINGLTYTVSVDGATAAQITTDFGAIASGASTGASTLYGTFSGTLSGGAIAKTATTLTYTATANGVTTPTSATVGVTGPAVSKLTGLAAQNLTSAQTGSNYLTLSGTVNGVLTKQSVQLSDNPANTTETINFGQFGIAFDVHSNQTQTAAQIGAALANINSASSTYGTTSNYTPGQIVVGQGANSNLQFQSGAYSSAFIGINTLNVQTGTTGSTAGTANAMMTVGTDITGFNGTGAATGTLGAMTANNSISDWQTAFQNAAGAIDKAVDYISTQRATYGSQMNRLSYISSNLTAQSTNLQTSKSAITDTNFAAETATLTKGQIMQQAATAMLAQANQMPNVILSLLK